MKKIVFVMLLFATLMLNAAESNATVTNTDGKSQVETSAKQIQPTKYNFTLFSFFNYVTKPKVDSASTTGTNGNLIKKKPEDN